MTRLLGWMIGLTVLVGVLLFAGFAAFVLLPTHAIPAGEPIDRHVYLDQGWGEAMDSEPRQTYYYTGQGAVLPQGQAHSPMRYHWFVNLELPFSEQRFADPEHMRRYRFLVDDRPTPANPDQLPVGFARHFDANVGSDVLDITCATCHTGQLLTEKDGEKIALRIDGGQAMHAFTDMKRGDFGTTMLASLIATRFSPAKFDRFAEKVLADNTGDHRSTLRSELTDTIIAFASLGQDNPLKHLYPVQEGFGRTDALGRIANTVFGDHLVAANYHVANAPVSYPFVWNIWKFDWVQYNASVKQPLARNIGEAMGVGAVMPLTNTEGEPLPANERFRSSVMIDNLTTIEHTLQLLRPPQWPEEYLGAVDSARTTRGRALFQQFCQGCHGPHVASAMVQEINAPLKAGPQDEWLIPIIPVEEIGTDPAAAVGFVDHKYDLSATGLTNEDLAAVLRPVKTADLVRRIRADITQLDDSGLSVDAREAIEKSLSDLPSPEARVPDWSQTRADAIIRDLEPVQEVAANRQTLASLKSLLTTGLKQIDEQLVALDVTQVTEGEGLNILGLMIKNRYYEDNNIDDATRQCLEGFGALDLPQQVAGYKPRPLAGVWATPPFLHNGSVPNLYEMFLPPDERTAKFFVGRRDFDTERVGYVTEPLDTDEKDGFWLDTTIDGNRNTGHGFTATAEQWANWRRDRDANPLPGGVIGPLLTEDQRWDLVEYLKIHRDQPETPIGYRAPVCST